MKYKIIYLFDLGIITLVMGVIFFSAGWYMGHHDCKQKVAEALKADAIHEASQALQQWVKIDNKYKTGPAFYLPCAAIHLKNGSLDAVKYNLNKALELVGK